MPKTTQAAHSAAEEAGVTLSLSAQQLKALGLASVPAPGAEVRLTATVSPQAKPDEAGDADHDAGLKGRDGDGRDGDGDADAAGDTPAPAALTLRISGLALTRARKAPDQVLYGSGD